MRQKPTAGYVDRLHLALDQGPRPMSVRALAREVGDRHPELRGTSYGGIRLYAEGKVRNPRVELLRALSDVLEIRGDWLAFGEGEMTEKEERERREVSAMAQAASVSEEGERERVDPAERRWERAVSFKWDVLTAMGFSDPSPPTAPEDDPDLAAQLGAFFERHNVADIPPWVPPLADAARRMKVEAEEVGRALRGPLEAFGIDPTGMGEAYTPGTSPPALNDYINAMVPVLVSLVGEIARTRKVHNRQEESHDEA